MRRRRWRSYARPVQLTSPVALELDGASAPGGGPRATPCAESEPWRPPSTHDRGAGQETAPLVGTRREAVWTLLGQQASSFSVPPFARAFVGPCTSPSQLIERVRLSVRRLLSSATMFHERASIESSSRGCLAAEHQRPQPVATCYPVTPSTRRPTACRRTRVFATILNHRSIVVPLLPPPPRPHPVSLTTGFSLGFVYNRSAVSCSSQRADACHADCH